MRKKTPEELEKSKIAKTMRTLVRLKHSLAADEELNALLPETLDRYDEALSGGSVLELKVELEDILGKDSGAAGR